MKKSGRFFSLKLIFCLPKKRNIVLIVSDIYLDYIYIFVLSPENTSFLRLHLQYPEQEK